MPYRPQSVPDAICAAARQRAARLREIASRGELSAEHANELANIAASIESLAEGCGPYRLVYVGDHAEDHNVTSLVDKLLPAMLAALDGGEKIMRYGQEYNAPAPSVLVSGLTEWASKLPRPMPPAELCAGRVLHSSDLHGARVEWVGYNFAGA